MFNLITVSLILMRREGESEGERRKGGRVARGERERSVKRRRERNGIKRRGARGERGERERTLQRVENIKQQFFSFLASPPPSPFFLMVPVKSQRACLHQFYIGQFYQT
jgi:hypothetical protein